MKAATMDLDGVMAQLEAWGSPNTQLAAKWMASPKEMLGRAGWKMLCSRIVHGDKDGLDFDAILQKIEAEILSAPYRRQEAMNCCLVAIGQRGGRTAELNRGMLESWHVRTASRIVLIASSLMLRTTCLAWFAAPSLDPSGIACRSPGISTSRFRAMGVILACRSLTTASVPGVLFCPLDSPYRPR